MFPNLTALIQMLALDNDGNFSHLKPESEWVWPDNAPALEQQAADLTEDERATMVMGEAIEMEALMRRRGLEDLEYFIGEVFDGELKTNFYRD